MKKRVVFHIDVNSAFLSWEAVRRLQEGDPIDLRTIPSAVGGDVESRHGVITAKSIPAKKYGVQTGEPVVKALQKCPNLTLVKSDFQLYKRMSQAFISICREYSEVLEQFSIDECFIDMTDEINRFDFSEEKALRIANDLRERIKRELMFTVNIGISENKLLAKMASDFKKPDLVHTLWTREIERKMWPLPAGDLLFVGHSTVERLRLLGIRTIGDIAKTPKEILISHLGEKGGEMVYRSSHGIDDSPVKTERDEEKSVGNSTTVAKDIVTSEEAYPVRLSLADSVGARLRKAGLKGSVVTVQIKSNAFVTVSRQRKSAFHMNASNLIYEEARKLFDELWDQVTPIRLLGVTVSDLSDGSMEQMSLFGEENREKQDKLNAMLDDLKSRFGKDAVMRTRDLKMHDE